MEAFYCFSTSSGISVGLSLCSYTKCSGSLSGPDLLYVYNIIHIYYMCIPPIVCQQYSVHCKGAERQTLFFIGVFL